MINEKKHNFDNNKQFVIFFFFVSPEEKSLRDLKESLKFYGIDLHKNTKITRKTIMINQIKMFDPLVQANYIGISSYDLNEEQLNKILSLLFVKKLKYIPFAIFYNQKILRIKLFSVKKNKRHFLPFYSINYD